MKKYVYLLIFVVTALAGGGTIDYVKIADERGRMLEQLKGAAAVVTTYPPDSVESRAAMDRGTMIAANWPCHWWEDHEAARLKATETFEKLIAVERRSSPPPDTTQNSR